MRSRVGWCCTTALPQHVYCAFFETPSISLREISFVIINRTRAGACLLLTEKPLQPARVQRLELRSLKFRRSMQACIRTPAALHDHKSCGSKRPHLPHPRLHARIPASPQAYRCGAAAPRAFTAHTCAPRAPRTYTYAPRRISRTFHHVCLLSSPFPSVIPLASVRNRYLFTCAC